MCYIFATDIQKMQQKMLSYESPKKVLLPLNSTTITAMRCRCAQTRRINNVLAEWDRRNRKRMLRYREYKRLRDSVPSIARKNVDKLTIITEAVSLIDRLEEAVLNRFQTQGIPKCLQGLELQTSSVSPNLNAEDLKQMMFQLMSKQKQMTTKSKTKSTVD